MGNNRKVYIQEWIRVISSLENCGSVFSLGTKQTPVACPHTEHLRTYIDWRGLFGTQFSSQIKAIYMPHPLLNFDCVSVLHPRSVSVQVDNLILLRLDLAIFSHQDESHDPSNNDNTSRETNTRTHSGSESWRIIIGPQVWSVNTAQVAHGVGDSDGYGFLLVGLSKSGRDPSHADVVDTVCCTDEDTHCEVPSRNVQCAPCQSKS